ncbi:MAG: hypothetical protein FJ109_12850 [Deltaproteobacteria bacterium]|nr:hypothetical protein [Deltaproteobacteria bacterium]
MRGIVVAGVAVCLAVGCVSPRFIANNMTGSVKDMREAFYAERSPQHAYAAAPGMLMQLDGFLVSSPDNVDLLYRAAELNCSFAMTFLDTRDRVWAADEYLKGREYALHGLTLLAPELGAAIRAGDAEAVKAEAGKVGLKELPLLFFTGLCWGGYINATMDAGNAAELPVVEALMHRVMELDETFYFGAVHVFFGVLNAGRSELLGGNLEKGRGHFEKALEITGGKLLPVKVRFAQSYAVQKQDPELFVRLLTEVLEDDTPPQREWIVGNAAARVDAAALLEKISDLFMGYAPGGSGPGPEEEAEDLDLD